MKKKLLLIAAAVIVVAVALVVWNRVLAPTKVAFVNYQITTLGQISKSNDNGHIKLREVGVDEIKKLRKYDMAFVNGMGLRLTAEQREALERVAEKVPVLTTAATNPDNSITSLDSALCDTIVKYLNNGGRCNYRSMLNMVRRDVDGKHTFVNEPMPVMEVTRHLLYHPDVEHPDAEEVGFASVGAYEEYLRKEGLYVEHAPSIVLTGMMGEPMALIRALEKKGINVYPVSGMRKFVRSGQIDSVSPSAIINMAHGRMGDYMTDWLGQHNIPLFTTVYVPQLTEQWEDDKMGMNGGFLSQSVVTPEIDGAIRPYALFSHRLTDEGLQEIYADSSRLVSFVNSVARHIGLQHTPNSEKKVAIYYYKGPGQNALTAAGLEVVPSLYNLLVRLRNEGYRVKNMPESVSQLEKMLQKQGSVLGTYAKGAFDAFLSEGNPVYISSEQYSEWSGKAFRPSLNKEVESIYGTFPGEYMSTADGQLAVARLDFGNIILIPQPMAGLGSNSFKIVHGADAAPPYTYIASYLYARYGFGADAIIHFGTHGSLEYTPRKQVALCDNDWSDRLIGDVPHFYLYTVGNVGEALIAKRRSYASLVSYITPPFMESGVRNEYKRLTDAIEAYHDAAEKGKDCVELASQIKQEAMKMGIHRPLGLDSSASAVYSEQQIDMIEDFAEEIANEKMVGRPYVLGVPYSADNIEKSVYSMSVDPIAYSLYALDKLKGKTTLDPNKNKVAFTKQYLEPAKRTVMQLLHSPSARSTDMVCKLTGISQTELDDALAVHEAGKPIDMLGMMMSMAEEMPAGMQMHADRGDGKSGRGNAMMRRKGKGMNPEKALKMAKMMGASDEALAKMKAAMMAKEDSQTTVDTAEMRKQRLADEAKKHKQQVSDAIAEVYRTVMNVANYRQLLTATPKYELDAVVNALNGGYTLPSPGGDHIVNPNVLPTGRNLYGINAENTPTEAAWTKGIALAQNTINLYRERHHDSLPRKVSYTLWSGEFIETEGATIAQVLYMLGVEPVRDGFGRVTDLKLIPAEILGRPRIDVCVQTSGQLRDLAASRLFLINRAVEMAAKADDGQQNYVADGVTESERALVDKGLSPREARKVASYRVFGGVNGGYGTGIQQMVQAGDRWEDESEIAETYLNNMGAFYGDEKQWESVVNNAFEAALTGTDAIIQPRQSNTWGALSLDHVYEFMGGLNLAVRNITGKDPDAYMSDYRNRNNARIQEVKEAIGVESRTTLFNPNYIKEMMKGGSSAAGTFAELVQNTYGWNVMKPLAIDNEMWDEIYDVYVKDSYGLGVQQFFESQNPAALQEITAVMMETARKGMWHATDEQLNTIAALHTQLVGKYAASCSPTVCDNSKLHDFVKTHVDQSQAREYTDGIRQAREGNVSTTASDKDMVLKREQLNQNADGHRTALSNVLVIVGAVVVLVIVVIILRKRSKDSVDD
ncbi:MAG: cobaltochelatase subunit CobN [Bacteroidales bacterium]|nr:cobaltochelatase subunit CobN [Bacteroidales bacterium]